MVIEVGRGRRVVVEGDRIASHPAIFDRRMSPQHGQAVGAGTTTRTRGS